MSDNLTLAYIMNGGMVRLRSSVSFTGPRFRLLDKYIPDDCDLCLVICFQTGEILSIDRMIMEGDRMTTKKRLRYRMNSSTDKSSIAAIIAMLDENAPYPLTINNLKEYVGKRYSQILGRYRDSDLTSAIKRLIYNNNAILGDFISVNRRDVIELNSFGILVFEIDPVLKSTTFNYHDYKGRAEMALSYAKKELREISI